MGEPRIIGLTGGIGTGKTTVANYLAERYGLPLLDADRYAREAVASESSALANIRQRYGPEVLLANGQLNRRYLADIIFADPQERQWVEAQIHPYVRDRLLEHRQAHPNAPILVMVIPLLFEAGMTDLVTETWVVYCSAAAQCHRLMARDRLTRAQAQARINSQMPLAAKIAQATLALDNSGSRSSLFAQIDWALVLP